MPRLNPYRPGSLVTPGMFAGRGKELQAFEQALWQTKNGNPEHLSIMGERGIGKSSLFFLYSAIAAGRIDSLNKINFSFANLYPKSPVDPTGSVDPLRSGSKLAINSQTPFLRALLNHT